MKNWKLVLALSLIIAAFVAVSMINAAHNQSEATRLIHSSGTILPHA